MVTDFNRRISSTYLSSYMDDKDNVDLESVFSASEVISRALYSIALDASAGALPKMDLDLELLNSTVYGLAECFFLPKPGMQCSLVQQVADSYLAQASFYPGIVAFMTSGENQSPNDKTDLVRFLWSFLATRAGGLEDSEEEISAQSCDFPTGKRKCPGEGQVCARWRTTEKGSNGKCVFASMQYIPAWSHHLTYSINKNGFGKWGINGTSATIRDEIWTESYWPPYTPSAQVYLTEGWYYEMVLFFSGLALTLCWFVAMRKTNRHVTKVMKQW